MKISDVLSYMQLGYVLRGDSDYTPEIDITALDIEYINGGSPTNEQFHVAASSALKQIIIREYSRALQNHIDMTARDKSYENGWACSSYMASTNQVWQVEAQAFIAWRDLVWQYPIDIYDQVEAGVIEPPTLENFIENSPLMVWPS